jgi:hypothetical protein
MTRAALLLAIAVLVGSSAGVSATVGQQSWYDADRGWRVVGQRIDATEDGGATWRTIRRDDGISVSAVLRTGVRSGLFVESNSFDVVWWVTNDGGRNWASSRALSPYRQPIGSGSFLFMVGSSDVVRVTPWPPPGAVVDGRPPRFRNQRLLRTAQGLVAGAELVPGGVFVVYYAKRSDGIEPRARVVRYRRDGSTVVDRRLPSGEPLRPCLLPARGQLLGVEWPVLTIPACREDAGATAGRWVSRNGGRNWSFLR